MKFSKLKLEIILMLVRDSHSSSLLENLKTYTTSTMIQIIHMLDEVEKMKFIEYKEGKYQVTWDGYQLLAFDNLESSFFDLETPSSAIEEDIILSYIPNKEREV